MPTNQARPGSVYRIRNRKLWEVDRILISVVENDKLWYRVRWLGGQKEDPSWYPAAKFRSSPLALLVFHEQHPSAAGPPLRLTLWHLAHLDERIANVHADDNTPDANASLIKRSQRSTMKTSTNVVCSGVAVVGVKDTNRFLECNAPELATILNNRDNIFLNSSTQSHRTTPNLATKKAKQHGRVLRDHVVSGRVLKHYQHSLDRCHRVVKGCIPRFWKSKSTIEGRTKESIITTEKRPRSQLSTLPDTAPILALPVELRWQIFDSLFSPSHPTEVSPVAIFQVNHQIRQEALGRAQKHATICAQIHPAFCFKLDPVFAAHFSNLKVIITFESDIDPLKQDVGENWILEWFEYFMVECRSVLNETATARLEITWNFPVNMANRPRDPETQQLCEEQLWLTRWHSLRIDVRAWFPTIVQGFRQNNLDTIMTQQEQMTTADGSIVSEQLDDVIFGWIESLNS